MHGGMDDKMGGGDLCRMQRMQLQGNKDPGKQGAGFSGEGTVVQHVEKRMW